MTNEQKQKPNNALPDLFRQFKEDMPFIVSSTPIATAYTCIINDDFHHVKQLEEIVNILENARDGDYVELQLSTDGGALFAVMPLLSAMKRTEAHVHVNVVSDVSSAGTLLMMLADSVTINEYATLMFHTVQYGYSNNGGNMDAYVRHTTQQNDKLIREMYTGFLTDAEIQRLLDGKEIYLTADDCIERFKNRDAARQAIEEAQLAAKTAKKPRKKINNTEGEKVND